MAEKRLTRCLERDKGLQESPKNTGKSWPKDGRRVGRLSKAWVSGAYFAGLGAKKTDCNLVLRPVLYLVGGQKNSAFLLSTPTLPRCPMSLFS